MMGAPLISPDPRGPVADAEQYAGIVGYSVETTFRLVREGVLQPPINPTASPRSWRWSRRLITSHPFLPDPGSEANVARHRRERAERLAELRKPVSS